MSRDPEPGTQDWWRMPLIWVAATFVAIAIGAGATGAIDNAQFLAATTPAIAGR